jgi:RNA-directed DNA polymerase
MKVFHNVNFEQLISLEHLFLSWKEFRKGKLAKKDVMEFERNLEDNIFLLHQQLTDGNFTHGSYSTFHIHDPKPRLISKAIVRDRLVHHLIFNKLYQIFDPTFIFHSYSSRTGKGTHLAVANLAACLRRESGNFCRNVFVLKCDIKKFFQSVNHQILLQLIQNKIKDSQFLWLIEQIVKSFPPASERKIALGGGAVNRHSHRQFILANFCQHIFESTRPIYKTNFENKELFQIRG